MNQRVEKKVATELKQDVLTDRKKSFMRSKGELRLVGPNFLRKFSSDRKKFFLFRLKLFFRFVDTYTRLDLCRLGRMPDDE